MSNAWESFFNAAQTLSAAGPIKQRLVSAYGVHLSRLQHDEIPREIRDDFIALGSCLAAVAPLRGETAVEATVRKMSDQEAASHALRIINLMGTLVRTQIHPRQPILRAVNSGEDLFSVASSGPG